MDKQTSDIETGNTAATGEVSVNPQAALKARRKRWLGIVIGAFAAVGIGYAAYWAVHLRYLESTDDAYVGGNVVQITPQISGTVIGIGADDTQFVKAGQALVRLDQADARLALDQAEAQLARTVREVRNLYATTSQLEAAVQVRQSDLDAAQVQYDSALAQYDANVAQEQAQAAAVTSFR